MSDNSFALDISKFAEKAKANANLVVRKISGEALASIVMKSPVDTGRFRANWFVTMDAPAGETLDAVDPDGAATLEAGNAALIDFKIGQSVFITNNLPYAQRLENGWSKQAPSGMVGLTVAEMQTYVADAVSELP